MSSGQALAQRAESFAPSAPSSNKTTSPVDPHTDNAHNMHEIGGQVARPFGIEHLDGLAARQPFFFSNVVRSLQCCVAKAGSTWLYNCRLVFGAKKIRATHPAPPEVTI